MLWFDALVQNVDRTWRNPNLLVWHGGIWLIDHGAALYFHHDWPAADPPSGPSTPASTCSATAVPPGSAPPTPRSPR